MTTKTKYAVLAVAVPNEGTTLVIQRVLYKGRLLGNGDQITALMTNLTDHVRRHFACKVNPEFKFWADRWASYGFGSMEDFHAE